MKIYEIRIYAEVLEQGIDFKEYISQLGYNVLIKNIYTKKLRGEFSETDTLIDRIRKVKDIDVLITAVCSNKEYPMLLVEYSTAVPTDDHKMQRSDVYYWSSVFKTPMMKISPVSKGMEQDFGGGSKFTDELEIAMACKMNAVFYPIHWENEAGKSILEVKDTALSCIYHSTEIESILKKITKHLTNADSFAEYFYNLQSEYRKSNSQIISEYTVSRIKAAITNSTRFHWYDDKLSVKINRFGHAMDPDRGVLYFVNMLLGAENVITEIQVNRPHTYHCRGGYFSLFDASGREEILKEYVQKIIDRGNIFTDEDAIYVFKTALSIDNSLTFEKTAEHEYIIKDAVLEKFLLNHPSITAKSIFYLSTELRLTDKNRDLICVVRWNLTPIKQFINNISSAEFEPTSIAPLSEHEAKEDIVTYASVELYKRIKCDLLAVSYPGAQGDRCVLTGSGRNVLRTYIDIIAYKNSKGGVKVYLEECKDLFTKSRSDVSKLNEFKTDDIKIDGLKQLFRKTIDVYDFSEIYTSVAAKSASVIPHFDVDYIFMFSVDNSNIHTTKINYSVAVIDTSLIDDFSVLKDGEGKLKGSILLDKIYVIDNKKK